MIILLHGIALVLFQVVDHSTSYASADLSKVDDLTALCTFLTIGWASYGWMAGTTVTATLLHWCFGMYLQFFLILSLSPSHCLYLVKVCCLI